MNFLITVLEIIPHSLVSLYIAYPKRRLNAEYDYTMFDNAFGSTPSKFSLHLIPPTLCYCPRRGFFNVFEERRIVIGTAFGFEETKR